MIAGRLVQINCVSPGGRLNNDRLERKVVDSIEHRVQLNRRTDRTRILS